MRPLVAACFLLASFSAAATDPQFRDLRFDVPAQSLQAAIEQLAAQAGNQTPSDQRQPVIRIVLPGAARPDPLMRTNPVKGQMTYEQALRLMLVGTGLRVERDGFDDFRVYSRVDAARR